MNCISSGQNLVWHSDIGATQTGSGFAVVAGHSGDGDAFAFSFLLLCILQGPL